MDDKFIKIVVDNRVFLLGLDGLFRKAQKKFEVEVLLPIVKNIKGNVGLTDLYNGPIEGYYTETSELKEYFIIVRTLQGIPAAAEAKIVEKDRFRKLLAYTGSRIFGRLEKGNFLLPSMIDPLGEALRLMYPNWNVPHLTEEAARIAKEWSDVSLVGLACFIKDNVVITALKESVVLYSRMIIGALRDERTPVYEWQVEQDLAERANALIQEFNRLTGASLPLALPENADVFYRAYTGNKVLGRCVALGTDAERKRYYHWAVEADKDRKLWVKDFWDENMWTTERYRNEKLGKGISGLA